MVSREPFTLLTMNQIKLHTLSVIMLAAVLGAARADVVETKNGARLAIALHAATKRKNVLRLALAF